jgi:hypothetical protein
VFAGQYVCSRLWQTVGSGGIKYRSGPGHVVHPAGKNGQPFRQVFLLGHYIGGHLQFHRRKIPDSPDAGGNHPFGAEAEAKGVAGFPLSF